MSPISTYELTIKEHLIDTYGHLNNANYVSLFEEARWEAVTLNGFGLKEIQNLQIGPVILEIDIKFKREIRNREKIKITTQVTDYKKKIFIMQQKLFNQNGDISCEATLTAGLMDLKTRKLILPPKKWLEAIEFETVSSTTSSPKEPTTIT